jgi:hypothetical protein
MSSAHIEERGNSPEAIQQEFPLPGGEVAHLPFAQIWETIYLPYPGSVRYDSIRRDRLAATGLFCLRLARSGSTCFGPYRCSACSQSE